MPIEQRTPTDRRPIAMVQARRPTGYVTQAMINEHGSFREALAVLNGQR